jgi:hypothetical protein
MTAPRRRCRESSARARSPDGSRHGPEKAENPPFGPGWVRCKPDEPPIRASPPLKEGPEAWAWLPVFLRDVPHLHFYFFADRGTRSLPANVRRWDPHSPRIYPWSHRPRSRGDVSRCPWRIRLLASIARKHDHFRAALFNGSGSAGCSVPAFRCTNRTASLMTK